MFMPAPDDLRTLARTLAELKKTHGTIDGPILLIAGLLLSILLAVEGKE